MCCCVGVLECWSVVLLLCCCVGVLDCTNKQAMDLMAFVVCVVVFCCSFCCVVFLLCWSAKTNKHGSHGIAWGGGTVVVLTAWLDPSTRHERQHEDEQRKKQANYFNFSGLSLSLSATGAVN